jgi:hypothetical protein
VELGPAVVPNERDFRLCHGYAETKWRGKHAEGGIKKGRSTGKGEKGRGPGQGTGDSKLG